MRCQRLARRLSVYVVVGMLAGAVAAHAADERSLPRIRLLATGGTIAGQAATSTTEGYQSGKLPIDALVNAVPEIKNVAKVSGEQISQIGSQDMSDAVWLKLAARVNQLLASPDVDGIVITHGTDTMEETAYFLQLTVHSTKPVVLTGSMRPANAIGADGPRNLYQAVVVAADPDAAGRGVLVVLNDDIHSGRDVIKTSTTEVGTFRSAEAGLIGVTEGEKIHYYRHPEHLHTINSEFSIDTLTSLPRVDILYAHANMSPDLVRASVAGGARGIVIAGVGNGNMRSEVIDALADAVKKGVVVVRSTRVTSGIVGRNVETDDDKMGFVASDTLNPAKSRVLLQLALSKTKDPRAIQEFYLRY